MGSIGGKPRNKKLIDRSEQAIAHRRAIVEQCNAISSFDGHYPSPEFADLQKQFVDGEISIEELKKLVLGEYQKR